MRKLLLTAFCVLLAGYVQAGVKLPWIISDNMVLQRDIPVKIWGWAEKAEKVTVSFDKQKISTIADAQGKWQVQLKPIPAGGPYTLKIKAKNEINIKNVLVGDVWVCSGQSNMEWPMNMSRNWEMDKTNTANNNIRLFYVPRKISEKPLENTDSAVWDICNEQTVAGFSAVGYYFGRNLQKHYNIPIGLINSNWGGTGVETWTSLDIMYNDPAFRQTIDEMKRLDLDKLRQQNAQKFKLWQEIVKNDIGVKEDWKNPDFDASSWESMKLPQLWEGAGHGTLDGIVWFRTEIEFQANEVAEETVLSLGPIDDSDETYINGVLVGSTYDQYSKARIYKIPPGVIKTGKNTIVVKVIDTGGGGGLWGKDDQLYIENAETKKNLTGNWKYKISLNEPAPQANLNPNAFPSLLYNGMINPLINYSIKGVIWYQGENNAGANVKYRTQFPQMIENWRQKWQIGSFPFLFVQLANYMEPANVPSESSWAGLREAQSMALNVPNTGMAVTIDIGEAKDIHPRNKDDVGYRLFLAAQKVALGEDIVYSGPTYTSMKIDGNTIVVNFSNTGSGLYVKDKYGYLKGFAIAGSDKKFYWAKARVTPDNKVIVYSDKVTSPIAVRYAWADNPDDANLYNKEMLPASPFRTDNW